MKFLIMNTYGHQSVSDIIVILSTTILCGS